MDYLRAVEQENAEEAQSLSLILEKRSWRKEGTFKELGTDFTESASWYEKAADQGHAAAAYELALLQNSGNLEENVEAYERAVRQTQGSGPISNWRKSIRIIISGMS